MAPLDKIEVELKVLVGRAEMPLSRVLQLTRGAVISLGGDPAQPLKILANGRPVAEGRVLLDGERVTVAVTRAARNQSSRPQTSTQTSTQARRQKAEGAA